MRFASGILLALLLGFTAVGEALAVTTDFDFGNSLAFALGVVLLCLVVCILTGIIARRRTD